MLGLSTPVQQRSLGPGVGPGGEVILPAYTWIESAPAAVMVDVIPVPAEVGESLTLNAADVRRTITALTRAIMPVHMHGVLANVSLCLV